LRAERLARSRGRTGLVVSRTSLFVNKWTKNIRSHFFAKWGLQESCSFVNKLEVFKIATYIEFALIVGQHGSAAAKPQFVHGLVDPNSLDVVARNLDRSSLELVARGPKPVVLNEEIIRTTFSKHNLSIPGITDSRHVDLATALHRAAGEVVYLDELAATVRKGVDENMAPKKGLSEYTEKIRASELPSWKEVLKGNSGKWVPLMSIDDIVPYRNPLAPYLHNGKTPSQYATSEALNSSSVGISRPLIAWRGLAQPQTNRRCMTATVFPRGVWCGSNCYTIQMDDVRLLTPLVLCLNSPAAELLCRITGGGARTKSQVSALPIPAYRSNALDAAIDLFESSQVLKDSARESSARIDALMWLHYGMNKKPLGREELLWVFQSQFECLERNDPEYKFLVLACFDELVKLARYTSGPTGTLFTKKVVQIASKASDDTTLKPELQPRRRRQGA
jgi:hypothetical protein